MKDAIELADGIVLVDNSDYPRPNMNWRAIAPMSWGTDKNDMNLAVWGHTKNEALSELMKLKP